MNCWVVIPVKPPAQAKSRLSEVLTLAERGALAQAMLRHVVAAAQSAKGVNQVALLGPSRLGLAEDVPLLNDVGGGLNPALQAVLDQTDADRMIVLFADLPTLTASDIERLVTPLPGTIAIAPDRHGTGTNALSLPLPLAKDFTFAFGADSFALHQTEAERLKIAPVIISAPGLSRDVDVPEDLADAAHLIG